jgi:hypothetical protein
MLTIKLTMRILSKYPALTTTLSSKYAEIMLFQEVPDTCCKWGVGVASQVKIQRQKITKR